MLKFIKNYFKYKHLSLIRKRLVETLEEKGKAYAMQEKAIQNLKDHNKDHVKCIAKYQEQANYFSKEFMRLHEIEKMLKSIIKDIEE